jgi:putative GTP pyrophosphokinase
MMERKAFLEKCNISEDKFTQSGLDWSELQKIHHHYTELQSQLSHTATLIEGRLRSVKEVHSLRVRLKEPEHLIEKIVRKTIAKGQKPENTQTITVDNYQKHIKDLIGVRALHLFKRDWEPIHDFVTKTWNLDEKPTANVRRGDEETDRFKSKKCKVKIHDFGYRSIHYVLKLKPAKETQLAELQVRTIFEEGWSEIDHKIRYPHKVNNLVLGSALLVFNRLAGMADEMGSYVDNLQTLLSAREEKAKLDIEEKNKVINELKAQVEDLTIDQKKKQEIQKKLVYLNKQSSATSYEEADFSNAVSNLFKILDQSSGVSNLMPKPIDFSSIDLSHLIPNSIDTSNLTSLLQSTNHLRLLHKSAIQIPSTLDVIRESQKAFPQKSITAKDSVGQVDKIEETSKEEDEDEV